MKRLGIIGLWIALLAVTASAADWKVDREKSKGIYMSNSSISSQCSNQNCKCNPCKCNPCKCAVDLVQCPDGNCPKPQSQSKEKPAIERDLGFVHRAYASSVRLSHSKSGGSATVIDCYKNQKQEWVAILLGCYHVEDGRDSDLKVEFFWPKNFEAKGFAIDVDKKADLCLMSVRVPEQVPYVSVSRKGSPKPGDRVLTIGCPGIGTGKGGGFKNMQSEPVGYFTDVTKEVYNGSEFALNYPAVGGHSGGGVFHNSAHVGVLVSRGNGQSQAVSNENCVKLYEKVFCEGEKVSANEDTCLNIFRFFRRPRPNPPYSGKPPYQGPPAGDAPDLTPEPPAPPPVPELPVVEEYEESESEQSPVALGFAIGIPFGAGALAISFLRKVKSQAAV